MLVAMIIVIGEWQRLGGNILAFLLFLAFIIGLVAGSI